MDRNRASHPSWPPGLLGEGLESHAAFSEGRRDTGRGGQTHANSLQPPNPRPGFRAKCSVFTRRPWQTSRPSQAGRSHDARKAFHSASLRNGSDLFESINQRMRAGVVHAHVVMRGIIPEQLIGEETEVGAIKKLTHGNRRLSVAATFVKMVELMIYPAIPIHIDRFESVMVRPKNVDSLVPPLLMEKKRPSPKLFVH